MCKDDDAEELLIHPRKSKCKFCQFVFTFGIQLSQWKTFVSYMDVVSAECRTATPQWSFRSQILQTDFFIGLLSVIDLHSESNDKCRSERILTYNVLTAWQALAAAAVGRKSVNCWEFVLQITDITCSKFMKTPPWF